MFILNPQTSGTLYSALFFFYVKGLNSQVSGNFRQLPQVVYLLLTVLSDRWLSRKLNELLSESLIERHKNLYKLKNPSKVMKIDPLFTRILDTNLTLEEKARLIADEISSDVIAVVLFGSLAKGKAGEGSDIDFLVVTESKENELNGIIYDLMFKYDAPVEAVFFSLDEFLAHALEKHLFCWGYLKGTKYSTMGEVLKRYSLSRKVKWKKNTSTMR